MCRLDDAVPVRKAGTAISGVAISGTTVVGSHREASGRNASYRHGQNLAGVGVDHICDWRGGG